MDCDLILKEIVRSCRMALGDDLAGVYLHGSLAMECFNPVKSDIDILIVVREEMTAVQKKSLMEDMISLNETAGQKGIEMSVVKRDHCRNFIYPTPFELHFSNMHLEWYKSNPADYIEKMNGVDFDLAAHFVVVKERGRKLWGEEIEEVFGEIPGEAYWDSIKKDIAEAENDVLEDPVYIILNLCRVLAYKKEGLVLSKKEGGKWGRRNMGGGYERLIQEALDCYISDREMKLNPDLALEYCKYMKAEIGFIYGKER